MSFNWNNVELHELRPRKEYLVMQPELIIREDGESLHQWEHRFKSVTGRFPNDAELATAPFPKVRFPRCSTSEKFIYCVKNFGLNKFREFIDTNGTKLWIFENDQDAIMFKLTFAGVDEVQQ